MEGGDPPGGAAEDGRKRKAEVLGRGGKRRSKDSCDFISGGSDNNKEDPMPAGEEAAGENPARKIYKEEAAGKSVNDSGEKIGVKADEKGSREEACNEKTKQEYNELKKLKADGWYLKSLDRYKLSDRSTEDLAAEGLKNFKAFKVTLDAELTNNSYSKITNLRESLAESVRFYSAAIESAKKVDKAVQLLTAGRNVIACLSHLINYIGPKEAFDLTVVAAETVTKVCREVPERLLLQGAGQAGRRGLLEVWTSLVVNLVEQAGQLQTREVVSRREQVKN